MHRTLEKTAVRLFPEWRRLKKEKMCVEIIWWIQITLTETQLCPGLIKLMFKFLKSDYSRYVTKKCLVFDFIY